MIKGRFRLEAAFFLELSLLFNCPFWGRIFTIKNMKINILIQKKVPLLLIPKGLDASRASPFLAHSKAG